MRSPVQPGLSEIDRLLERDRELARSQTLEDDFTMLEITFE